MKFKERSRLAMEILSKQPPITFDKLREQSQNRKDPKNFPMYIVRRPAKILTQKQLNERVSRLAIGLDYPSA